MIMIHLHHTVSRKFSFVMIIESNFRGNASYMEKCYTMHFLIVDIGNSSSY